MGTDYPDPQSGSYYPCPSCRAAIQFGNVEYMGQIDSNDTLAISFRCDCYPTYVHKRRFRRDDVALRRLLGRLRPVLPYHAAPLRHSTLTDEQETALRVFSWETAQLESVAEFLLLASRPPLRQE